LADAAARAVAGAAGGEDVGQRAQLRRLYAAEFARTPAAVDGLDRLAKRLCFVGERGDAQEVEGGGTRRGRVPDFEQRPRQGRVRAEFVAADYFLTEE
jgi:hypothetical protein